MLYGIIFYKGRKFGSIKLKYLLSKCIVCLFLLCVFNKNSYAMGILYEYEPHKTFTSVSLDGIEKIIYDGDLDNQILQKYAINDIIFVLETHPASISGKELEDNNAKVYFDLNAFTKNPNETTSFKVRDIHVITDAHSIAKSDLIIRDIGDGIWSSSSPFLQGFNVSLGLENCEVYCAHTESSIFLFPSPKDMDYSIEILFELNQNGKKSLHTLQYDYRLEMEQDLFYYVGP